MGGATRDELCRRTKGISRSREENKHTNPQAEVFESIKIECDVGERRSQGWCSVGKAEAVQNFSSGLGRMNRSQDAHDAPAPVALENGTVVSGPGPGWYDSVADSFNKGRRYRWVLRRIPDAYQPTDLIMKRLVATQGCYCRE